MTTCLGFVYHALGARSAMPGALLCHGVSSRAASTLVDL